MGILGPGYRSLARIRQEELRQEREAGVGGLGQEPSLDEDMVAARAERRRRERDAAGATPKGAGGADEGFDAGHAPEPPAHP